MRIGIDAQILVKGIQGGHYYLTLGLLQGFHDLNARDPITLFIRHSSDWREEVACVRSKVGGLDFPIRRHGIPGRPYRLRQRFAAINRVDIFLQLSPMGIRIREKRCNAFVLTDVIPLRLPHLLKEKGDIKWWSDYFDLAKHHGDIILTLSEHTRGEISETLGVPGDRIKAVPLAAGPQFRPIDEHGAIAEQLSRWGLERDNYVLSVGTLEPRKNHCLILEAYERLRAQRRLPRGCKLVFAGGRGWMYEPIFERIDSLGLREEVVVLGHADPLEYLYNGAIMMIYPSFMEGFGLPPLEAMGCGTPVIISNTTSLPEVVGDAGIMIDPHDVDGLVEAMGRLLADPAARHEMRTRGLARAANFTWERTASGYLNALNEGYINFSKKCGNH